MFLWPGSCALRPPFIPCCSYLCCPRALAHAAPALAEASTLPRACPQLIFTLQTKVLPCPPHATFPCNTSDLVTSPNGICWWLGGVGGIQRPEHTITGGPGSASPGPRGHFLLPPPLARGPRGPLSMTPTTRSSYLLLALQQCPTPLCSPHSAEGSIKHTLSH